ncbi:MAG: nuclear transport factor 2 family protein [Sedimentitalea sp.]|nr:nuclear transport factor 2 family protein [Sedimentitalea sp.]
MRRAAEYPAIAAVVRDYVFGMCQGEADRLRAAFHEKSCCIGHFEGGLEWDPRDAFIAGVTKAVQTPDPDPWYEINAISVVGDMATVQVENIWLGVHYDDTLVLLHHDGRWQIVSKVFSVRGPTD